MAACWLGPRGSLLPVLPLKCGWLLPSGSPLGCRKMAFSSWRLWGVLGAEDGCPPSGLLELHDGGHPAFRSANSESHMHQEACGSGWQAVRRVGCSGVRLRPPRGSGWRLAMAWCPAVPRSTEGILGQRHQQEALPVSETKAWRVLPASLPAVWVWEKHQHTRARRQSCCENWSFGCRRPCAGSDV